MLKILRYNIKQRNLINKINSSTSFINIKIRNFSESSSNSSKNEEEFNNFNSNETGNWIENNNYKLTEEGINLTSSSSSSSSSLSSIPSTTPITPVGEGAGGFSNLIPPEYHPFQLVAEFIHNVHQTLDIPYWGSIMLCTVGVRLMLFPMAILQSQNSRRAQKVGEETQKLQKVYTMEVLQKDPSKQTEFQQKVMNLYADYGFAPSRLVIFALIPAPIFISFFFGLQKMPELYPEFATGGLYFFQNLGAMDPYYVLPVINGGLFLLMTELNKELQKKPEILWGFRGLGLFIGGVSCQFPASVTLYWCTSNLITLIQSKIITHPEFLKLTAPVYPKDQKQ